MFTGFEWVIHAALGGALTVAIWMGYEKAAKKKVRPSGSLVDWIVAAVAAIGLFMVWFQMSQANEHKRWDNYNSMNNTYRNMFDQLQKDDYSNLRKNCLNYLSLNHKERAWIRSYYNLYAEEFDLDDAGLLPDQMMNETISRGFRLNLNAYPSIAEGFKILVSSGAFDEESDFVLHVNNEIRDVENLPICELNRPFIEQPNLPKKMD